MSDGKSDPPVQRYINRELSWLTFNQRVLDEAADHNVPLLERLKFLAITASNLDEFFMVRIGSLKSLIERGGAGSDASGLTPSETLAAARTRITSMVAEQYRLLSHELLPELAKHDIRRIHGGDLTDRQRRGLNRQFETEFFPVLTPIAVTAPDAFPLLPNSSLALLVRLAGTGGRGGGAARTSDTGTALAAKPESGAYSTYAPASEVPAPSTPSSGTAPAVNNGSPGRPDSGAFAAVGKGANGLAQSEPVATIPRMAVIPLSRPLPRLVTVSSERGSSFMLIEDVIAMYLDRLFPGETVKEVVTFRITRNADVSLREDLAADLMEDMRDVLIARRESDAVRVEIDATASRSTRAFLRHMLGVNEEDEFSIPGPIDLSAMMPLANLSGFDRLRYSPWPPLLSPQIDLSQSMFDLLASGDVLLIHPFESFEPVVRLIEEAADDPDVLSIKQTLYRTSRDSPIVAALRRAAENGKYVSAIVELKARFDEERNIGWARRLELSGVNVVYGVKGLKTHAKACLIVRREPQGVVRYIHFGTGNYNEATARLYGDISVLTTDERLAADTVAFFNAVTGYSQPHPFSSLAVAPIGLRDRLLEMIENERDHHRTGGSGLIRAKLNALVDPKLIEALYAASADGVPIDLNVRGICCLRAGVPGLSETIRVVRIVDRILEHARIVHFRNGGDDRVFISSADWMPRNLDRRIELLVPVERDPQRAALKTYLDQCFQDNVKASTLGPEDTYQRLSPESTGRPAYRVQETIYRQTLERLHEAERSRRTMFQTHERADS